MEKWTNDSKIHNQMQNPQQARYSSRRKLKSIHINNEDVLQKLSKIETTARIDKDQLKKTEHSGFH